MRLSIGVSTLANAANNMPHLPACPLKRFTVGAQMEAFDSKRSIEIS
jgi:hypothetical protein